MALAQQRILLGISGGIAAYKTPDLVRQLRQAGVEVRVIMTESAKAFVTPISLQAVSGQPVLSSLWETEATDAMDHIQLAKWADTILIAPASASCMARVAHGFADDLLTTACLASQAKLVMAPAMNQQMWHNPATQKNAAELKALGWQMIGPEAGEQACGDTGLGRMTEPSDIVKALNTPAGERDQLLSGEHVMITAGPTREAIDPVRYISNHSSGKMGYALAKACQQAGAKVTLVSGPTQIAPPAGITTIDVTTAQEMHDAVHAHLSKQTIFIGTAAVADYGISTQSQQKIKKHDETLTLTLTRNPDILSTVAYAKTRPLTIGFAAETQHVVDYAKDKLERKNLDLIFANQVGENKGFNQDANQVIALWPGGEQAFTHQPKETLATDLVKLIAKRLKEKNEQ